MSKQAGKAEGKKKLRSEYLKRRNELSPEQRKAASKKIREWVFANKRYKAAKTVFVYASYKSEVETKELIQGALRQGKRVAVPKVNGEEMDFFEIQSWEELFPGYQGILEPQSAGKEPVVPVESDIFLLPGAVFDRSGGRIGYGGGYYDRYLERISAAGSVPYLMALGFRCQLYSWKLPLEEHDRKMDCILTEKSVIMPKKRKNSKIDWVAEILELVLELVIDFVIELLD